jgi:16S rRNA A1518/A1519 N6-dimethyltransferase RsmA/KsgA/DIM1 with predicted DNA glycosylase/AP lyase activity
LLQTFYNIEYCFTVDENQFSPPQTQSVWGCH